MNTNFKVIGLTRLGIKLKSTAPEADARTNRPSELSITEMTVLQPQLKNLFYLELNMCGSIYFICHLLRTPDAVTHFETENSEQPVSTMKSRTTLDDVLETIKLLEEEPEHLPKPKSVSYFSKF